MSHAEHRGRTLAGSLAFELACARADAHKLGLGHELGRDLDKALMYATALAAGRPAGNHNDFSCFIDWFRAEFVAASVRRAHLRASTLDQASGCKIASELARSCSHARDLESVYQAAVDTGAFWKQVDTGAVTPWAACVLAAAARLMPDADRSRYCAEYRSELCDLASAGASFRQQLMYAVRQLLRVVPLRAALIRDGQSTGRGT